jgi:hypothetical protein
MGRSTLVKKSTTTTADNSTQKPNNPYRSGFTITAREHIPPEPWGAYYRKPLGGQAGSTDWPDWDNQVDYCLEYPLRKGKTLDKPPETLRITSVVRRGYNVGSQLVVVNHDKVAKIFDPLYYEGINEFNVKQDVVAFADGEYSREAAAYRQIMTSKEAKRCTPAFYGCFTAEIETPTRGGKTAIREVPLVLMEYVKGTNMADVRAAELEDHLHNKIMRKVLEAGATFMEAGVKHRDIAPQNIFIVGEDWHNGDFVVKIFDFNQSLVCEHAEDSRIYAERRNWANGKINNPITMYWSAISEFERCGWFDGMEDAQQWLLDNYLGKDQYTPVSWDRNTQRRPEDVGWMDYSKKLHEDDSSEEGEEGEEEDSDDESRSKVKVDSPDTKYDPDVSEEQERQKELSEDEA